MNNEIVAIWNDKLRTWIKIYENNKMRYYFTREEANEIIEEYKKDKDKCVENLIEFDINTLIKHAFDRKEEADL